MGSRRGEYFERMGVGMTDQLWGDGGLVKEICTPLGLLYRPRKEQQLISALITEALNRGAQGRQGVCLIEAGTGVGKTLGYMIPGALRVAACKGRMLVSTHTLDLMRQIVERDGQVAIRVAERVSGHRLKIALLRGRRNFASPSRCRALAETLKADGHPRTNYSRYFELAEHVESALKSAREALQPESRLAEAGIVDASIKSALLETFESETGQELARDDVCLLSTSPLSEQASYFLNRKMARDAEILVTTHASTAISLMTGSFPVGGSNGDGKLDLLVVDEADQWASSAASVAMIQISLETVRETLLEMTLAFREKTLASLVDKLVSDCMYRLDELGELAPKTADVTHPVAGDCPVLPLLAKIEEGMAELAAATSEQSNFACDPAAVGEIAHKIERLLRLSRSNNHLWSLYWRTSRILAKPSLILQAKEPGRLLRRIWDEVSAKACTTVLTSATLAAPGFTRNPNFQHIRASVGLTHNKDSLIHADLCATIHPAKFGILKARFAHPRAPAPSVSADGRVSRDFLCYCASVISEARSSGERVLVLVPSYSDIEQLSNAIPGALLHYNGAPLKPLLEDYKRTKDACLITPAGWVGLDLPGLVPHLVISRLPFPPRTSQEGSDPFSVGLGAMLIKLSQGVGRAIRRPQDTATLWFADPRMPPPCALMDRHMIAPHPLAQGIYLSAIPHRFRTQFETDHELTEFAHAPLPALVSACYVRE